MFVYFMLYHHVCIQYQQLLQSNYIYNKLKHIPISSAKQHQNTMSTDSKLAQTFRTLCLTDLTQKLTFLQHLPESYHTELLSNSQQKLQCLSKILVQFEDYLIQCIRNNIKYILEIQETKIKMEMEMLEVVVLDRICEERKVIQDMVREIQSDVQSKVAKKIMGNIGSGKFQEYWRNFTSQIQASRLTPCQLICDKQKIQEQVEQLIQTLNFKPIKHAPQTSISQKNIQNISQISQRYGQKNASIFSQAHQMLRSKYSTPGLLKKQSIVSVSLDQDLKQQTETINKRIDYNAIDEYKETKTQRKAQQLCKKIKQKQKSPEKQVNILAKLALERKRLLKQLE